MHIGQDPADRFYADLLRWRAQFDRVLVAPDDSVFQRLGAEALGGARGEAFYPLGSASERFMVSYKSKVTLIYQRRKGTKAVVVWQLPVVQSKSEDPVVGTIPNFLLREGLRISPSAKLTPAIQKKLTETGTFATYSYHSFHGGFATVLRPDGTETEVRHSESKFVITPEEKELLRPRFLERAK